MKKKIISLLLCTTLVVGACGKYSHAHEEKYISPKSAIAISGATATAILTLATYAGIQFHDSETFDEFLRRMCGMEQSVDFLVSVTSLVGKSIDGTIEFTEELINDFKLMLNRISLNKDLEYVTDANGYSLPVLNVSLLSSSDKRLAFVRSVPNNYIGSSYTGVSTSDKISYSDKSLSILVQNDGYVLRCNNDCDTTTLSNNCLYNNGLNSTSGGYGKIVIPGVYRYTSNSQTVTTFGAIICDTYQDESKFSYMTAKFSYCKKHTLEENILYEKELNMTIGDAWSSGSGEITSNNDSGGVSLKIPSSMDTLIDKSPSDVSTPTYDTWNPGKDVSIPSIDNPAIEYTPDTTDTDNPGDTDTDNPGDTDTGTQNPVIPDFGDITVPDIDLTPLQLSISSITEKFPFSLPWDIKRIAETFKGNSSVNAPIIEFEFNNQNVVLDFNRFNAIAIIVRGFVFVEFAIGLIYVLRKVKP